MESPNRRCFETPDGGCGPCVFLGTVISVETVYSCLDIFLNPIMLIMPKFYGNPEACNFDNLEMCSST